MIPSLDDVKFYKKRQGAQKNPHNYWKILITSEPGNYYTLWCIEMTNFPNLEFVYEHKEMLYGETNT